jgi:hypothetical protein
MRGEMRGDELRREMVRHAFQRYSRNKACDSGVQIDEIEVEVEFVVSAKIGEGEWASSIQAYCRGEGDFPR